MSKMTLQDAAEELKLADDPTMESELMAAFPVPMQKKHADAIRAHRLRHQIVATYEEVDPVAGVLRLN